MKKIKKNKIPVPTPSEEEPDEEEETEEEEEEETEEEEEKETEPKAKPAQKIAQPNRIEIMDIIEGHLLRAGELLRYLRGQ
jgi:hypothetical protein